MTPGWWHGLAKGPSLGISTTAAWLIDTVIPEALAVFFVNLPVAKSCVPGSLSSDSTLALPKFSNDDQSQKCQWLSAQPVNKLTATRGVKWPGSAVAALKRLTNARGTLRENATAVASHSSTFPELRRVEIQGTRNFDGRTSVGRHQKLRLRYSPVPIAK